MIFNILGHMGFSNYKYKHNLYFLYILSISCTMMCTFLFMYFQIEIMTQCPIITIFKFSSFFEFSNTFHKRLEKLTKNDEKTVQITKNNFCHFLTITK